MQTIVKLAFVILLFLSQAIWAQDKQLVINDESVNIDPIAYVQHQFLDEDATLDEVQSLHEGWQELAETGSSFGYRTDALWMRLNVVSNVDSDLILLIDYAILDFVDVYVVQNNWVSHLKSGDRIDLEERAIKHRKLLLPLNLSLSSPAAIYIRVKGGSSFTVPLKIMDRASFYEEDTSQTLFLSLLFGAGFALCVLNFFLGLSMRHSGYLYYAAFIFSFTMVSFIIQGFSRYYLFPDYPIINDISLIMLSGIGGISYVMFFLKFLPVKAKFPWHYRVCQSHIAFHCIMMGLGLIGFYEITQSFVHLENGLFAIYSMVLAYIIWRAGEITAMFIFIGWLFLMLAVVVKVFLAVGWLPYQEVLFNSFDLGMTLNYVLTTFAMGYQIVDTKLKAMRARTDAVHAREEAQASLSKYRAIFENAPVPMFKINQNDEFIEVNKAFLKSFQLNENDVIRTPGIKSQSLYTHNQDYLNVVAELRRRGIVSQEIRFTRKNGQQLIMLLSVRALIESGEQIYEGACIDITLQKQQQQQDQLRHEQEVKQLEALVSGVAHYLNSPLGAITTAQSVIKQNVTSIQYDLLNKTLSQSSLVNHIENIEKSVGVIEGSMDKSINVVNRFRELKPDEDTVKVELIQVTELVEMLQVSLVRDSVDPIRIEVIGDQYQSYALAVNPMLTVLNKLTRNAKTHGNASVVYLSFSKVDHGCIIRFSDNGSGLAENVSAESLFHPFFAKTLSLQEVSGLDLFVVKTIIQNRLGGRIDIDSDALPALCFEMYLPSKLVKSAH